MNVDVRNNDARNRTRDKISLSLLSLMPETHRTGREHTAATMADIWIGFKMLLVEVRANVAQ